MYFKKKYKEMSEKEIKELKTFLRLFLKALLGNDNLNNINVKHQKEDSFFKVYFNYKNKGYQLITTKNYLSEEFKLRFVSDGILFTEVTFNNLENILKKNSI